MAHRDEHGPISRRTLMKRAAAGMAGIGAALDQRAIAHRSAATTAAASGYGPFRMCFQSYCLRHFLQPDEFVREAAKLELPHVELYRGHLPTTSDRAAVEDIRGKLSRQGIKVVAFGVEPFTADHAKNEQLFRFGRMLGVENLSASPSKDAFPSLEKLVKSYNIKIAIHNHGPEDELWRQPEWVRDAVQGLDSRIGSCADLGHFIRAGVDPIRALEMLGPRVLGCHFKDFDSQGKDVVVGTGRLDVAGALRMLKKIGFSGPLSLEFEGDQENPVPKMLECLSAIREAVEKI